MADINNYDVNTGHKKIIGVKKTKKLSTRIDMTPMVDLGFLLITFFIFTTTMSTPSTMSLNMPKVKNVIDSMKIKNSNALTFLIGREKKGARPVYYYLGKLEADGSNFKVASIEEIRKIIIDKRKEVMGRYINDPSDSICLKMKMQAKVSGDPDWMNACRDKDFFVIIKPTKDARYATTIDILDEMAINSVKSFAIVDILPEEKMLIEKSEAFNHLR
jgi:biopolymer transport protein ExbD